MAAQNPYRVPRENGAAGKVRKNRLLTAAFFGVCEKKCTFVSPRYGTVCVAGV